MVPGSGVFLEGQLADGNDSHVYTVFLREGEVYDFWLGGESTEEPEYIANPKLELSGGPGVSIAIDDNDSAEGLNATLSYSPPAGGSGFYQITVRDVANADAGGYYDLAINNRSLEADLSDHIFAYSGEKPIAFGTHTELTLDDVLVSDIAESFLNSDADVAAVYLVAGVTYNFNLRGADTGDGTLADSQLRLLSANGLEKMANDGAGSNASLTFTPTQTGMYFVEASGGDTSAIGSYTLQFTGAGVTSDVNGNIATLANLPLGDAVRGEIGGAAEDGSDWYAIHLVAGQQYQFDLTGMTLSDPGLTLRNSAGTAVTQGVDVGTGTNDRIVFTPTTSGLFFLDAHDEGVANGKYELSAHRLGAAPAPVYSLIDDDDSDTGYLGSGQADAFLGGQGSDIIDGQGGNDTAEGGGGADVVQGGAGNDALAGNLGDDEVSGGDGNDTLSGGAGNDLVLGDGEGLEVARSAGFADGAPGADQLFGGSGDDTLDGLDGNDTMSGDIGNDAYIVGSAGDVVSESANQGIDTVQSSLGYTLGANVENLTLDGAFNVSGTGNALTNVIYGNGGMNLLSGLAGNDTLNGGQGHDTLVGGAGKDLLTGSGGLDRMVFTSLSDSGALFAQRDAINTFAHGDKIDLSALDARTTAAGNQAFTFVTNFTHAAGQLQWDQVATNAWYVSGDVNGDAVADFSLNVYSAPGFGQLQSWDFIL
jgi:Ca2+-binding RTX toxin-like protein